jgi:hypothetical protein
MGRVGLRVAGLLVAITWGVIAGWWTPRGPVTTTQALASIAISLVVGFLAGWLTRSRWAMLLAPALSAATVEVARIGYVGPTVDRPHFSALGILAVQRRPELYQAYIGAAQAVDLTDSERSQYADTLAWACAKGDTISSSSSRP